MITELLAFNRLRETLASNVTLRYEFVTVCVRVKRGKEEGMAIDRVLTHGLRK